jgi:hypothetical protein
MEFQEDIKQWVSKDNQIRAHSERIKGLRQDKNTLTGRIFEYAEENNLHHAVVQITDGKLKFHNTKVTAPLTFRLVEECLTKCLNSEEQAKEIIKFIKSERGSSVKSEIKRFYN